MIATTRRRRWTIRPVASGGSLRVNRGGSWASGASFCRASYRNRSDPGAATSATASASRGQFPPAEIVSLPGGSRGVGAIGTRRCETGR